MRVAGGCWCARGVVMFSVWGELVVRLCWNAWLGAGEGDVTDCRARLRRVRIRFALRGERVALWLAVPIKEIGCCCRAARSMRS
jgi:hypothetical protein